MQYYKDDVAVWGKDPIVMQDEEFQEIAVAYFTKDELSGQFMYDSVTYVKDMNAYPQTYLEHTYNEVGLYLARMLKKDVNGNDVIEYKVFEIVDDIYPNVKVTHASVIEYGKMNPELPLSITNYMWYMEEALVEFDDIEERMTQIVIRRRDPLTGMFDPQTVILSQNFSTEFEAYDNEYFTRLVTTPGYYEVTISYYTQEIGNSSIDTRMTNFEVRKRPDIIKPDEGFLPSTGGIGISILHTFANIIALLFGVQMFKKFKGKKIKENTVDVEEY
jgi:hypothetical protein